MGILDSPRALLKWSVAHQEVTSMLKDADDDLLDCFLDGELEDAHLYHKDNKVYEERFRKDMTQLYEKVKSRGNPFIGDGKELANINSKFIVSRASSASVRNALKTGPKAYDNFCEERLVSGKHSMRDTISQNKPPLFRQTNTQSTSKSKLNLLSFKSKCQLDASLYVASQAPQANLDEFFAHGNHAYPVSEYGKLRKTDKSEFLNCLQDIQGPSYDEPQNMEIIVTDGEALVHMNPPKYSKTFGAYCESELGKKLCL